ncbi:MAG: hypothetical protein ACKPKO_19250, partial [Candidatus Fonsibacter sp.]
MISVMAETKYNGISRFHLKSLNDAAKAIVKKDNSCLSYQKMINISRRSIFVLELVGLGIEINAVV